jgi:adenylate cyclase
LSQSRQLAAIMFTDIVGYTTIMGSDEQKAFSILSKNRSLQQLVISQNNGRWIKELGDGVIASFTTVSDAVNAAINIQEACNNDGEYQLRIGIHLGEVVFENNDVFGDGVNIASRIQAIAKPGSIFVSEPVHHNISNKQGIQTKFVKEESLKNVKEHVRIFEVMTTASKESASFETPVNIPLSSEKSIAVLPFVNMSNDAEQDYFCDGITEEIINALAQLNNLRVIARTSVFSYKGKNIDVREIGKSLNVLTLLEGSVRKSNNRLRITTKLVKVSDGSHLWSDRYDRELVDIFSIQEDIATNVATSLKGFLTIEEKEIIRPFETDVYAYECFLRGRQFFHQIALMESRRMFEKAIEIDPGYAPAHSGLADVHSWIYEWEGAKDSDLKAAEWHSRKALSLAPNLAESHASRGFVLSLAKRYDEAEEEFNRAIQLSEKCYNAYYYYGRSCFSRGQVEQSANLFCKAAEVRKEDFQSMLLYSQSLNIIGKDLDLAIAREGIERARKHLELDPADRRALSLTAGYLFDTGEKEEGIKWIEKALILYPGDAGVLFNGACLFAKSGDKQRALSLLELAFNKGYGNKGWIENDPDYDSIRDEPRFKALLKKLS